MRTRPTLAAIGLLAILVTAFFAKELFTDATLVTFRLDNVYPWLAEATREDLSAPSVTSDCTLSYYPRVGGRSTVRASHVFSTLRELGKMWAEIYLGAGKK